MALRWYLGLDLFDRVPDHSTISQLRRRKPTFRKVFRRLFEEVVEQCIAKGLASGRLVGTDSAHVKANASRVSEEQVELTEEPGVYWLYLADKRDCQSCPFRSQCLRPEDGRGARKLEHSYFMPQRWKNLERRALPEYREALRLRQIWCEGTFAIQKRCHNLTQLLRRGREAAEDHCLLSAAALNLKRLIRNAD